MTREGEHMPPPEHVTAPKMPEQKSIDTKDVESLAERIGDTAQTDVHTFIAKSERIAQALAENEGVDDSVHQRLTGLATRAQEALETLLEKIGLRENLDELALSLFREKKKATRKQSLRFLDAIEKDPAVAEKYLDVMPLTFFLEEDRKRLVDVLIHTNPILVNKYFMELSLSTEEQERFCEQVASMPATSDPDFSLHTFVASRIDSIQMDESKKDRIVAVIGYNEQTGEWIANPASFFRERVFQATSPLVREAMLSKLFRMDESSIQLELSGNSEKLSQMNEEQKQAFAQVALRHQLPGVVYYLHTFTPIDRETLLSAFEPLVRAVRNDSVFNSYEMYKKAVEFLQIPVDEKVKIVLASDNRSLWIDIFDYRCNTEMGTFIRCALASRPDLFKEEDWGKRIIGWVEGLLRRQAIPPKEAAHITADLIRIVGIENIPWLEKNRYARSQPTMEKPLFISRTFDFEYAQNFCQELLAMGEVGLVGKMMEGVDLSFETQEQYLLVAIQTGNSEDVGKAFQQVRLSLVVDHFEIDSQKKEEIKKQLLHRAKKEIKFLDFLLEYRFDLRKDPLFSITKEDVHTICEIAFTSTNTPKELAESLVDRLLMGYREQMETQEFTEIYDFLIRTANVDRLLSYRTFFELYGTNFDLKKIAEGCVVAGKFSKLIAHRDLFQKEHLFPELFTAYDRMLRSPSQSLHRIKDQLIAIVGQMKDPVACIEEIEDVFIGSHLPDVGKQLKIFEIIFLQDKELFEEKMKSGKQQALEHISRRGMKLIAYRELTRVHIDSNNPSLREYLENIRQAQSAIQAFEEKGFEDMDASEQKLFSQFCKKMEVAHRLTVSSPSEQEKGGECSPEVIYKQLQTSLGVKKGQSIIDRFEELFLRPVGYASIDTALVRMSEVARMADARGRSLAEEIRAGTFVTKPGDQIKGIDQQYSRPVLRGGSVAMEFLGSSSNTDLTPFNTDFFEITSDLQEVAQTLGGYGPVFYYVRDRGQFIRTDETSMPMLGKKARERKGMYELLKTGVINQERHTGITVGLASSEFDAIVLGDTYQKEFMESLEMDIATNGWYIPIISIRGELLFTPEQYDSMREHFLAGIPGSGVETVTLQHREADKAHTDAIDQLIKEKKEDYETNQHICTAVREHIMSVLTQMGVTWKEQSDTLLGAVLLETGSSSRLTNRPKDYDFDFALRLDPADYERSTQLQKAVEESFLARGGKMNTGGRDKQLRFDAISIPGIDVPIAVDLAFVPKNEVDEYASHQAVEDRLHAIRETHGQEAYERVIANIIYAKMQLTQAQAYKKGEWGQGGLGGIGVENWILSNGGDFLTAAESFVHTAFSDADALVPFSEFRSLYPIMDPGINLKGEKHDNFIDNMTADGYERMARFLKEYLTKHVL